MKNKYPFREVLSRLSADEKTALRVLYRTTGGDGDVLAVWMENVVGDGPDVEACWVLWGIMDGDPSFSRSE